MIAAMACHSCVHAQANTGPQIDNATILAASRTLGERASQTRVNLVYTGTFKQTESSRHFGFQVPQDTDLGFEIDPKAALNSRRLYSSSIMTDVAADRAEASLSPVPREQRKLTAEIALSAPAERTGLGFDVGIAPRIAITRDGTYASRRFGGEVRIGQNFDKRGKAPNSSWYLFAGADGEALVWEPDDSSVVAVGSMALHDQVTVGDIQAGLSIQRGAGQISFSYIRREVEYRERTLGASENEDFAGISFTLKR
ncbi:MAG: lipid A deacylase LpxR family protein [Hyphomonadaceae bacterium]|nr:lipid A deacylase LpxR family protein [Hyphomonadaceae bacterium]